MFHKRLVITLAAGIASLALPAFSQSEASRQEVSVQAFGSFVSSTTENGVENKATNSGGVLGSYRYFFSEHHGVEADYGYALNTQAYGSAGVVAGREDLFARSVGCVCLPHADGQSYAVRSGGRGRPRLRSQGFRRRQHASARRFCVRRRPGLQHVAPFVHARRVSWLRIQFADLRPGRARRS